MEDYLTQDEELQKILIGLKVKGLKLFLISNSWQDQIRRKLRILGIREEWFESLIAGYDDGGLKPDLQPFEKAIFDLEVKPEECLYVGNQCNTDVVGAKNAGMKAAMIGDSCVEADLNLNDIYEIGDLFRVRG